MLGREVLPDPAESKFALTKLRSPVFNRYTAHSHG